METKATDPYKAPEGDLRVDEDGFGEIRFFSPSTRIGRIRYLSHSFLLGLCSYAFFIPGLLLLETAQNVLGGILLAVGYIGLLYVMIIIGIQRLHDVDKSGWLLLLFIVPLANLVIMLYLLFASGTQGSNRFGLQPPPNKTWNRVCVWIAVIFWVGSIFAITIPAYQDYVLRAQGLG